MTGTEGHVVLGSDEGVFVVRAEEFLDAEPWDGNTLVRIGEDETAGEVWVLTGDQWGPFDVTIRLLDTAPPHDESWEDVVELSVTTPGPFVVAELSGPAPTVELPAEPGTYRLRVSARGRATDHEDLDDAGSFAFDEARPVEWYLLEAWPAPALPPEVVRLASDHARALLAGDEPLDVPGTDAALAAAARIGRSVDDGARDLSGRTGRVVVEHTFAATRRRLFAELAYLVDVTSWVTQESGWSAYGGGERHAVGTWWVLHADDDSELIAGHGGALHNEFVESEPPRRAVRRLTWLRVPAGTSDAPVETWLPLLGEDTLLSLELTEERSEDEPLTAVRLEHTGVPVEWVADLETWWRFQLEVVDRAGGR